MKSTILVLILAVVAGVSGHAASQASEFAAGRAYYTAGEFRKAAVHLQLALKANPNDAESWYWLGRSYQVLADMATPFGGKYKSKARVCLTKATELAPGRSDYRHELFEFLVDPADSPGAALKQAAYILRTLPEDDPDYTSMHQRFEQQSKASPSAEARLGTLFLVGPRAVYRIAELPASAISGRRAAPRVLAGR